MTTLDDISLAFDDIIDTPAKRKRQVAAADQEMRQRYAQSQNPFALLGAGIAGSIKGNTENLRRALVGMGGTGFKTQGENIAEQLRGIDTNNVAGQNQVLAIVGQADPGRALALKEFFNQKNAQMGATNAKAAGAESLRNTVRALVEQNPQSRYSTLISSPDFINLPEEQLNKILTHEGGDRGLKDFAYLDESGDKKTIIQDKSGNYYHTNMELMPMEEVPEVIMSASIVAADSDVGLGGNIAAQNELLQSTIDIQQLFNTTNQLMEMLEDNPDILTRTGTLATWTASQVAELNAIQNAMRGQAAENEDLTFEGEEIDSALDTFLGTGRAAAEARPLILALAYTQAASEQSGQSISDSDIIRYLDRLGAGQKDADTMAAILRRNAENQWIAYETNYAALNDGATPESDFGLTNISMPKELRIAQRQREQRINNLGN